MERQIPLRLHEAQYQKLKNKASKHGTTMALIIRNMIDNLK